MSAFIKSASNDANEFLSGIRACLPTLNDVVETAALAVVASFAVISLNVML